MNLLFVTQYFPPETGAAPARALHFARALARAGHDVRVVTGLPNHPSGSVQPAYREGAPRHRAPRRHHRRARVALRHAAQDGAHAAVESPELRPWRAPGGADGTAAERRDRDHAAALPRAQRMARRSAPRRALRARLPRRLAARGDRARRAAGPAWSRACCRPSRASSTRARRARHRGDAGDEAPVRIARPGPRPHRADHERRGHRYRSRPDRRGTAGGTPLTVLYAGTHGLVHGMEALVDAIERLRDRDDLR